MALLQHCLGLLFKDKNTFTGTLELYLYIVEVYIYLSIYLYMYRYIAIYRSSKKHMMSAACTAVVMQQVLRDSHKPIFCAGCPAIPQAVIRAAGWKPALDV